MIRILIITIAIASILYAGGEVPPQLDPYNPQYEPGVVLVKFKDDVALNHDALAKATNPVFGISSVDMLNLEFDLTETRKVFKQVEQRSLPKMVQMPQGYIEAPNLHNTYKLTFDGNASVETIVQAYSENPNIEFAEPDYLVGVMDIYPNDPLLSEQWHLDAVNAPQAWEITAGDSTQVIGILDTGVDYDHPDLTNKIWTNTGEIPDNGLDDDGNGFVDDIHGWDFVNDDNNPDDDNSHGTHVAGIAAAESNNGVGISGIAWNSKIMSIKVFQSSGYGSSSDVASAIEYASDNGAQILNFSGGGYSESMVVKIAIANAYAGSGSGQGSILIAAAGNSYFKIDKPFPPFPYYAPMFPGCYGFVVGVEATDQSGQNAPFSNFDPTGPILTDAWGFWNEFGHNYEIKAPGVGIYSTFPNGGYHSLSGTSMATPIVSGAVALLKNIDPSQSNETIIAKLIQSSNNGMLDILSLLECELVPDLYFEEFTISDTLISGDNDGIADSGERIELFLTVKNAGGATDSVWTKIRFGGFEDTTTASIIDSTSYIGSLSEYSHSTGQSDPFVIQISPNLVNDRHIIFEYEIGSRLNTIKTGTITIVVQNGIEISGTIAKLELNSDAYYLVSEPAVIDSLIIHPGVTVRFSSGMFFMITDFISAVGSPDSMITFKGANDAGVRGIIMGEVATSNFEYCIFEDGSGSYTDPPYLVNPQRIHNSIFRYNHYKRPFDLVAGMDVQKNIITDNWYSGYGEHNLIMAWGIPDNFRHNIVANNIDVDNTGSAIKFYGNSDLSYMRDNVFIGNEKFSVGTTNWNGWPMGIYNIPEQYWGASDEDFIRSQILDFYEYSDRPALEPDSILVVPPVLAHGVVTDILIDSISINKYDNPYNGAGGIGNISVQNLEFKVVFNRPMNVSEIPLVTFGVTEPYTQQVVIDSAWWSLDSTIWTAYKSVGLETGDGLQTVRVANALDDEYFSIPIEQTRFEFIIQAAGALSVAFYATPGIGKVDLEWPPASTDDALGYNMYRAMRLTDSTWTAFEMINNMLITDSTHIDFSVVPDSTYRYHYTVLGTDFAESDPSKNINTTPFSAANGDANGDLSVNVLDIISMVSYVLEGDPTPFLFDAADLNGDDQVNVLDIIGVINVILGGTPKTSQASLAEAGVSLDEGELWVSSQASIAGMQFTFTNASVDIRLSSSYPVEIGSRTEDGELTVVLYSLKGEVVPTGAHEVLTISNVEDLQLESMLLSNGQGQEIPSRQGSPEEVILPEEYVLKQNYPNPFNATTTIEYAVPKMTDIKMTIYNIRGQEVFSRTQESVSPGWYSFTWTGNDVRGETMASGLYLYRFEAPDFAETHKMLLLK